MDRRQVAFTGIALVLALVLGAGVALLATSGDGDDEAADQTDRRSTTTSSVPSTTTTTTLIPRPVVTVPTSPPPTIRVVPPPTEAPTTTTTKAKKPKRKRAPKATTTTVAPTAIPQAAPSTQPTAPPTTSTSTSTSTTTTSTSTTTPSTTTTTVPAPSEIGISPDEIRLTVVADDARTVDGATAWANAVNRREGLAGREVRLDVVVTDGTAESLDRAVDDACEHSFAIVASHFAADDAAAALQQCGIPDVPVEPSSATHAANATTFAAFPRQPRTEPIGPYRWLQDELDGCCTQFVLVPADDPGRTDTEAAIDAAAMIGFETAGTPDVALDAPSTVYDALAQDLFTSGTTFAASGLGADSTLELRRAASAAGVTGVQAWYCDARCYATSVNTDSRAEREYVGIETVPFGDRRDVAELRSYLRAAARTERPSSYEGLRTYVAGVLFEEAVAGVVADHGPDGLTRPRLVESLGALHAFTGRGLVGATDVGARAPNGCFVLLQVDGGRFTRIAPSERGSLDCGSQNLVQLDG